MIGKRSKPSPNALGIFLKYPQPGKVKTRLAKTLGQQAAACAYRKMIDHCLVVADKLSDHLQCYLMCDPYRSLSEYQALFPRFEIREQVGSDLGNRLENAIQLLLEKHGHAVIIGTDCIELDDQLIHQSFESLQSHDLVIGPANDGGYYLIGMKHAHDVFSGVAWSTEKVFEQTIALAQSQNLTFETLVKLSDIDHEHDLPIQWQTELVR